MAQALGILFIFLLAVLRPTMSQEAGPSCPTIESKLNPCVAYIEGRVMGGPSSACCAGVKAMASEIKNKQDLVALCTCVKGVISKLGNKVVPGRISGLARKCGVPIDLPPIDKNYDCSKILVDNMGSF